MRIDPTPHAATLRVTAPDLRVYQGGAFALHGSVPGIDEDEGPEASEPARLLYDCALFRPVGYSASSRGFVVERIA
jgi:hypothetical protein